jgi:hypothetical protein
MDEHHGRARPWGPVRQIKIDHAMTLRDAIINLQYKRIQVLGVSHAGSLRAPEEAGALE